MTEKRIVDQHHETFESIRQFDAEGNEFWVARQLAKVLEYSEYRHFQPVIERAKEACRNSGHPVEDHFEEVLDMVDASQANMGLTSWSGSRVRQGDVTIAKNYLQQPEIDALNRIVVMYLDHADDMAQRRQAMTMQDWIQKLDAFLAFNERDVLAHAGKLRADVAEKLALERYETFGVVRREAARMAADAAAMENVEQELRKHQSTKKNLDRE